MSAYGEPHIVCGFQEFFVPMENGFSSCTSILDSGSGSFEVLVLEPAQPVRTVLFSTGWGGNPKRHHSLLESLAEQGCTVIAPHLEQLASSIPTEEELLSRVRRLELAAKSFVQPDMPIAGVGHSIGATILLVLAGGHAWTLAGKRVSSCSALNLNKLALLAPATDFFRMPGALDSVHAPILAWAGTNDSITPSRQAEFLKDALEPKTQVHVCLVEGAGHFTFMNELPPHLVDTHPDRDTILANLADGVCRFVLN